MYTAIIAFRIAVLCSSIKHDRCFTAGVIKPNVYQIWFCNAF